MKETTFITVIAIVFLLAVGIVTAISIKPQDTQSAINQRLCVSNGLYPVTVQDRTSTFTNFCIVPGTVKGYWINNGRLEPIKN